MAISYQKYGNICLPTPQYLRKEREKNREEKPSLIGFYIRFGENI